MAYTTRTTETETVREVPVERKVVTSGDSIAARIVKYITGILLALLAFRFILALLGANPANAFANFIYTITYPFVSPFFSLFSYNLQLNVARFELFTLIAMLVYGLVGYGIAALCNLGRNRSSTI